MYKKQLNLFHKNTKYLKYFFIYYLSFNSYIYMCVNNK